MTEVFSNKTINSPGEVSIGASDSHLRQITHVAGGTKDTDAVNVRQIKALEKIQTASEDYEAKTGTALDKTQQHETMASTYATDAKIALDAIRDYETKSKTAFFELTKNPSQTYSGAYQVRELVGQLQSEISYISRMAKQAPDGIIIYIGHL